MDSQNQPIAEPVDLADDLILARYKPATAWGRIFRIIAVVVLPIGLIVGGVATKIYLDNNQPPVKADKKAEKSATVDTFLAKFENIRPTIRVYGQTVAGKQLNLRANVGGEVLQISPNFKSGALVDKGELLFTIDPFAYEGALLNAQSRYNDSLTNIDELEIRSISDEINLKTSKDQLISSQKDYDRSVILRERGTITRKTLDDKLLQLTQRNQAVQLSENNLRAQVSQMQRLQTSLKTLQWSIDEAKKNLRNTKVHAPFDAYVQNAAMQIGQLTGTNEQVATLIERSKMDINFTLSDGVYGRILAQDGTLIGREVKLIWQAGNINEEFSATIDRVAAKITAASGGVELFAKINSLKEVATLRVGTFMTVEIPDVEYKNVLRVPEHVVYDGDVVYILDNQLVKVDEEEQSDGVDNKKLVDTDATKTDIKDEPPTEPQYENRLQPREITILGYDAEFTLITNRNGDNPLKQGDVVLKTRLSIAGPEVLVTTLEEAETNRAERLKLIEEKKAEDKKIADDKAAKEEKTTADTAEKVGE